MYRSAHTLSQTHDVNMPSSQKVGGEAGTALMHYGAGFDLLLNYSPPWQDLTRDFDDVKMFCSNTVLSNEVVHTIFTLAYNSPSRTDFGQKLEELWCQIGPWQLDSSAGKDHFKSYVRHCWKTAMKLDHWSQYEDDMLTAVRKAENQNAFTRDAWYLWKNLNDSWLDDLNYGWQEVSFRTWAPAIWMCEQERRHTENSKPTSESFIQETNDPDPAGEEVMNHYIAEGQFNDPDIRGGEENSGQDGEEMLPSLLNHYTAEGRFNDAGTPDVNLHKGMESPNQTGEETLLKAVTEDGKMAYQPFPFSGVKEKEGNWGREREGMGLLTFERADREKVNQPSKCLLHRSAMALHRCHLHRLAMTFRPFDPGKILREKRVKTRIRGSQVCTP